jgi:phage terminase large subunit-like protein
VGYLDGVEPESFDRVDYLARRVAELREIRPDLTAADLLKTEKGRRSLTRHDPLAFALVYFPEHLRSEDTGNEITMSRFHLDLFSEARNFEVAHGPQECRSAWVAPRGTGKSTLAYLILPMWALAHGHRNFVIAFADSGPQAQQHLMSFKRELDTNELLRTDYLELCTPATRPGGVTVADRQDVYIARSGAAFVTKGADAAALGAKIENRRPDLILFDDIEPAEAQYSLYQKAKRLDTVTTAIFPMSLSAVVMFTGTTTMAGSIVHDLVRQITDTDPPEWPRDEKIRVHYYPAIVTRPDGSEASLWPARWTLEFLQSIRHTKSYAKNYDNQPGGHDGDYWQEGDITYGTLDTLTRRLLLVDPATTAKKTSDRTGVAVVAFSPTEGRCVVEHAEGVQLTGRRLAAHLAKILRAWPHRIHAVIVEVNQGGDLWPEVFEKLPARVITSWSDEGKDVRFTWLLDQYQRPAPLVLHAGRFHALEGEMYGYPRAANDDIIDAVCAGVERFIKPPKRVKVGAQTASYA